PLLGRIGRGAGRRRERLGDRGRGHGWRRSGFGTGSGARGHRQSDEGWPSKPHVGTERQGDERQHGGEPGTGPPPSPRAVHAVHADTLPPERGIVEPRTYGTPFSRAWASLRLGRQRPRLLPCLPLMVQTEPAFAAPVRICPVANT